MTNSEKDIYALARARTQESIERVAKKRKRTRTKESYTPEAYEEHKAQCRARSKAYAETPEGKEAHRKTAHAWYEAHKHDPEFIESRKEAQARYRAKVAADPVKNAARKEYMHDYCVKRYAEKKLMEAESLETWK
jgi:hypothetical protein